ncbi:hypothetical protein CYMTET_13960 [Cymbomonas tetramitiformis]|uniref:Magnesium transporter MgtE intracellular domain-containing protein n=1 Tax=Cymbomonas tetramitiformis TaxID=36881 RepID=A0AAE0LAV1_9CHLO|nr:hypothetical protein CYMTET_13960 [Cymbomonas tetramitiformis]
MPSGPCPLPFKPSPPADTLHFAAQSVQKSKLQKVGDRRKTEKRSSAIFQASPGSAEQSSTAGRQVNVEEYLAASLDYEAMPEGHSAKILSRMPPEARQKLIMHLDVFHQSKVTTRMEGAAQYDYTTPYFFNKLKLGDPAVTAGMLTDRHVSLGASLMEALPPQQMAAAVEHMAVPKQAAEILGEMNPHCAGRILEMASGETAVAVLLEMDPMFRASNILSHMPNKVTNAIVICLMGAEEAILEDTAQHTEVLFEEERVEAVCSILQGLEDSRTLSVMQALDADAKSAILGAAESEMAAYLLEHTIDRQQMSKAMDMLDIEKLSELMQYVQSSKVMAHYMVRIECPEALATHLETEHLVRMLVHLDSKWAAKILSPIAVENIVAAVKHMQTGYSEKIAHIACFLQKETMASVLQALEPSISASVIIKGNHFSKSAKAMPYINSSERNCIFKCMPDDILLQFWEELKDADKGKYLEPMELPRQILLMTQMRPGSAARLILFLPSAVITEIAQDMPTTEIAKIAAMLSPEDAQQILLTVSEETRPRVLKALGVTKAGKTLSVMETFEATEILALMPAVDAVRIVNQMTPESASLAMRVGQGAQVASMLEDSKDAAIMVKHAGHYKVLERCGKYRAAELLQELGMDIAPSVLSEINPIEAAHIVKLLPDALKQKHIPDLAPHLDVIQLAAMLEEDRALSAKVRARVLMSLHEDPEDGLMLLTKVPTQMSTQLVADLVEEPGGDIFASQMLTEFLSKDYNMQLRQSFHPNNVMDSTDGLKKKKRKKKKSGAADVSNSNLKKAVDLVFGMDDRYLASVLASMSGEAACMILSSMSSLRVHAVAECMPAVGVRSMLAVAQDELVVAMLEKLPRGQIEAAMDSMEMQYCTRIAHILSDHHQHTGNGLYLLEPLPLDCLVESVQMCEPAMTCDLMKVLGEEKASALMSNIVDASMDDVAREVMDHFVNEADLKFFTNLLSNASPAAAHNIVKQASDHAQATILNKLGEDVVRGIFEQNPGVWSDVINKLEPAHKAVFLETRDTETGFFYITEGDTRMLNDAIASMGAERFRGILQRLDPVSPGRMGELLLELPDHIAFSMLWARPVEDLLQILIQMPVLDRAAELLALAGEVKATLVFNMMEEGDRLHFMAALKPIILKGVLKRRPRDSTIIDLLNLPPETVNGVLPLLEDPELVQEYLEKKGRKMTSRVISRIKLSKWIKCIRISIILTRLRFKMNTILPNLISYINDIRALSNVSGTMLTIITAFCIVKDDTPDGGSPDIRSTVDLKLGTYVCKDKFVVWKRMKSCLIPTGRVRDMQSKVMQLNAAVLAQDLSPQQLEGLVRCNTFLKTQIKGKEGDDSVQSVFGPAKAIYAFLLMLLSTHVYLSGFKDFPLQMTLERVDALKFQEKEKPKQTAIARKHEESPGPRLQASSESQPLKEKIKSSLKPR